MDDAISRKAVLGLPRNKTRNFFGQIVNESINVADIERLPSAPPEYEPVKAEDFAKTMSENTPYTFMEWYGVALKLMGI